MKITKLKDHALLKAASAVSREYLVKCEPNNLNNNRTATRKESFAIDTFLSVSYVVSCIDQLYYSSNMLSGYRSSNAPDKMNRYDYILFGIENYYLRITSIFDRCLRLSNIIFQIGLPERQCNYDSIVNNSHLKGTSVSKSLTELDKFTREFRPHRNTIAHKRSYSERELEELGMYYGLVEEDNSFDSYRFYYKNKTDDFVSDKKLEFNIQIIKLENLIEIYYDSVQTNFEKRLKIYSEQP